MFRNTKLFMHPAMRMRITLHACAIGTLALATACATGARGIAPAPPVPLPTTIADTIRSERLAPGVWVHHLVRNTGPLRAYVLDIDRSACVSVRALKGSETAVGRTTTGDLLRMVPSVDVPLAAVNADFFLFAPPGVPVGALVVDGRLLAGPVARPVLAFDRASKPSIGVMQVRGTITSSSARISIASWNRPAASAIGIVDDAWGQMLDSIARPTAVMLIPLNATRFRISALSSSHDGRARADTLLLVGSARASLVLGDTVTVNVSLAPAMPHNAVGGFPLLVRDSAIVPTIDSDGAVGFRGVNPRTAAGYADNGNRLFLVVIDGRQAGHSVGTTTRETAELMRDLGARDALNLDGGGSSAMVVRDGASGTQRVVNKPSDAAGERPVANALAVLGVCQR